MLHGNQAQVYVQWHLQTTKRRRQYTLHAMEDAGGNYCAPLQTQLLCQICVLYEYCDGKPEWVCDPDIEIAMSHYRKSCTVLSARFWRCRGPNSVCGGMGVAAHHLP